MPYGDYVTQIGPDGSGHERCGGACIASCLLSDGWQSDPYELMVQVSDQCGFTDSGATSQQMLDCAAAHGLDGRLWIYAEEAVTAVAQGEAVLCLLDNQYMEPRTYPAGYQWEAMHWVRVRHISDFEELAYVYDPLTWQPQKDGSVYQGPVASTLEGLLKAIQATPYPEAGVILTSRQGRDLNRPPE